MHAGEPSLLRPGEQPRLEPAASEELDIAGAAGSSLAGLAGNLKMGGGELASKAVLPAVALRSEVPANEKSTNGERGSGGESGSGREDMSWAARRTTADRLGREQPGQGEEAQGRAAIRSSGER